MPSWDIYLVILGSEVNLPKHVYKGDIKQIQISSTHKKKIKEVFFFF